MQTGLDEHGWNAIAICAHSGLIGWWRNSLRSQIWRTFRRTAKVESHPVTAKYKARLHHFGEKVFPGIFMGPAQNAERSWKRDILVADAEESQDNHAPGVFAKRISAKGLVVVKGGTFVCLCANGMIKLARKDSEVRTSEQIRQGPEKMEHHNSDHPGEDDKSDLAEPQQLVAMEAKSVGCISGRLICRHHVQERQHFYVPQESSLPIPLKYVDVVRRTNTTLDVLREHRIDDRWNVDGDRKLSGLWTGFTHFTHC